MVVSSRIAGFVFRIASGMGLGHEYTRYRDVALSQAVFAAN
jgi:hypothetical protein